MVLKSDWPTEEPAHTNGRQGAKELISLSVLSQTLHGGEWTLYCSGQSQIGAQGQYGDGGKMKEYSDNMLYQTITIT
jgi:hypothetical protein